MRSNPETTTPFVLNTAASWLVRRPLMVCALLGFFWYCANGGFVTLDPTFTGWLRSEDLSQHFLGWLNFRHAPLSWPIGRLDRIGYPVGSTLGFMDANPLMSSLFRPFTALLPTYFQFQGFWLASCFTMQGYLGGLLGGLLTKRARTQILAASFFIMAPPALLRVCHENLASHWLLLAGLYLLMRADKGAQDAKRAVFFGGLCLALALSSHAYIAAMLIPLLVCAIVRRVLFDKSLSPAYGVGAVSGYAVLTGLILTVYGFLGSGISQAEPGFGLQSADLTTFFNPKGWSRFLPDQPVSADQFEGYAYLGLGGMLLVLVGIVLGRRKNFVAFAGGAWLFVVVLAAGYFVMALSDCITFRGVTLVDVRALSQPLMPVLSIFRASGRFIWIPYYVLIIAGLSGIIGACGKAHADKLLFGLLLIQCIDVRPDYQDVWHKLTRAQSSPFVSPTWQLMRRDYEHIDLVPPMFPSSQKACRWTYDFGYQVPYAFLAYENNMTVNSVYAGRANTQKIDRYCETFWRQLEAFKLDDKTVYVVDSAMRPLFADPRMHASCGQVDGRLLCVSATRSTKLEALLRRTLTGI